MLFGMRLVDAARSFGVSLTTMKTVCRRLGIERCPYSRTGRVCVRTGISSAGISSTCISSTCISSTGISSEGSVGETGNAEGDELWFLASE